MHLRYNNRGDVQLPTALLAAGIIFPRLRHDTLFATTFFLFRLAFHAVLLVAYATPHGRAYGTQSGAPSMIPALFFALPVPLHLHWVRLLAHHYRARETGRAQFASTVRGLRRRRGRAAAVSTVPVPVIVALPLAIEAPRETRPESPKHKIPTRRRLGGPLTDRTNL
jgi:hypothetical protein